MRALLSKPHREAQGDYDRQRVTVDLVRTMREELRRL